MFLWLWRGDSHRMVDAQRFAALLRQPVSSISSVQFLGTDGSRAYLTHWRMGLVGSDTNDVYSVALDDLPAADRAALRAGRDPWAGATLNEPLNPAERDALAAAMRLPPTWPILVALRRTAGQPARVARDHFDRTFTDDTILPVPVPCPLVVIASADENATARIGETELGLRVPSGGTDADWLHFDRVGDSELVVSGSASTWHVRLRGIPAAKFYTVGADRARSK